jgi:hypothetical protein
MIGLRVEIVDLVGKGPSVSSGDSSRSDSAAASAPLAAAAGVGDGATSESTVSSTRIRACLQAGRVAEAAALLGRPHRLVLQGWAGALLSADNGAAAGGKNNRSDSSSRSGEQDGSWRVPGSLCVNQAPGPGEYTAFAEVALFPSASGDGTSTSSSSSGGGHMDEPVTVLSVGPVAVSVGPEGEVQLPAALREAARAALRGAEGGAAATALLHLDFGAH